MSHEGQTTGNLGALGFTRQEAARFVRMALVYYSLAGEGRGHAIRAGVIIDELRKRHRVVVFTYDEAYKRLSAQLAGTDVPVIRIPGLGLHYHGTRMAFGRTFGHGMRYLWGLRTLLNDLQARFERDRPDLVVTDFEPALARAAKRCGVPFISLDHQHFLQVNDLSFLPLWLRRRAEMIGLVVKLFYSGQAQTVVSSFYHPPLKPAWGHARQIGVLLRREVLRAMPQRNRHLLCYLRRFSTPQVLEALARGGRDVYVYGLGERPREGRLEFRPANDRQFLEDLAACEAVVCTAGNQLVGEALYLGKPVYALPEANNFEQYVNAHFLAALGAGAWTPLGEITPAGLQDFLARGDEYRQRINPQFLCGNTQALEIVADYLPDDAQLERKAG